MCVRAWRGGGKCPSTTMHRQVPLLAGVPAPRHGARSGTGDASFIGWTASVKTSRRVTLLMVLTSLALLRFTIQLVFRDVWAGGSGAHEGGVLVRVAAAFDVGGGRRSAGGRLRHGRAPGRGRHEGDEGDKGERRAVRGEVFFLPGMMRVPTDKRHCDRKEKAEARHPLQASDPA